METDEIFRVHEKLGPVVGGIVGSTGYNFAGNFSRWGCGAFCSWGIDNDKHLVNDQHLLASHIFVDRIQTTPPVGPSVPQPAEFLLEVSTVIVRVFYLCFWSICSYNIVFS